MTSLFGNTSEMPIAVPKKKRTLLPLLTVLFVLSYAIMTMLIVEQGAAIQSQGNLIKVLMPDSRELWSIRAKAISDKQAQIEAQKRTQTPSTQASPNHADPNQAPSTQTPQTQIPGNQIPGSQAPLTQQHQSRAGRTSKSQLPPVPASDLVDQRRALRTI